MFSEEIQQLRTVPETPVVSREIRVVSPGKTWQYFQVSDNRIGEVRCDGQPVLQGEKVPGKGDDSENFEGYLPERYRDQQRCAENHSFTRKQLSGVGSRAKTCSFTFMILRRGLSYREGILTPKITLIYEKTAPLFWEIPDLWPVWLPGAVLWRKLCCS